MVQKLGQIVIPTNPSDLKKLKGMVQEGCDCLLRTDAEKEALKDIIAAASEEFDIPKSYISKMIKHKHKNDLEDKVSEFEDLHELMNQVDAA